MVSRSVKIRLGVFLTLGTVLVAGFFLLVMGNRLVERMDTYYLRFENYSVTGLQEGGAVNYQGIKVGRVDKIKIDPQDVTKIIITIKVQGGTPIKEDTEAVLILVGITGLKAVEIRGGTNQTRSLKPGSYIKTGTTMIDSISDRAVSIADKIDSLATNLNNMTDAENRKNISEILRQTSLLLNDTRTNIASTLLNLNQLSENTVRVTSGLSENLNQITASFTRNLDTLTQTSKTSLESVTGSASTTLQDLSESTTRAMNTMSDKVAQKLDLLTNSATMAMDSIGVATRNSLEKLTTQLNRELDKISFNLNNTIADVQTQAKMLLEDTRNNLNTIGTNSNELILSTSRQITQISTNINHSLEKINAIFDSPEFESLVGNLNTLSGQLTEANMKGLVAELTTTVNRAAALINNIDRTIVKNRANLTETMDSLREAMENLNEFSKQIADQPWIMLRGN
jgi:phospholipid/cholesterol/gamma-HCH transport system substrate-binding protein